MDTSNLYNENWCEKEWDRRFNDHVMSCEGAERLTMIMIGKLPGDKFSKLQLVESYYGNHDWQSPWGVCAAEACLCDMSIEQLISIFDHLIDKGLITRDYIDDCPGRTLYRRIDSKGFGDTISVDGMVPIPTRHTGVSICLKIGNRKAIPDTINARCAEIIEKLQDIQAKAFAGLKEWSTEKYSHAHDDIVELGGSILGNITILVTSSKKYIAELSMESPLVGDHVLTGRLTPEWEIEKWKLE